MGSWAHLFAKTRASGEHIIARYWQGAAVAGELDLVIAHAAAFKSGGGAGQIEGPHPVKPLIEHIDDRFFVFFAFGIPSAQGFGIMQPQRLDIGVDQA